MKEPTYYTGEKPMIYYTVHAFPAPGQNGHKIGDCYKTIARATKAAEKAAACNYYVNIRKETVYRRTASAEFSTSGIVKTIENGGFLK